MHWPNVSFLLFVPSNYVFSICMYVLNKQSFNEIQSRFGGYEGVGRVNGWEEQFNRRVTEFKLQR